MADNLLSKILTSIRFSFVFVLTAGSIVVSSCDLGVTNSLGLLNEALGGGLAGSLVAGRALSGRLREGGLDVSWAQYLNKGILLIFTHFTVSWSILKNSFLLNLLRDGQFKVNG